MMTGCRGEVSKVNLRHLAFIQNGIALAGDVPIGKQNTYQPVDAIVKYIEAAKKVKAKYVTAAGIHEN